MINMSTFNHSEWLQRRIERIGGSDAAAVIGANPYKTNLQLWEEKTGRAKAEDISNKPCVKYGTEAEKHLRELFKLDFPQYKVMYEAGNMWTNDDYPFAHASLDGWLQDESGRNGILEIKTTEIMRAGQKGLWKDRIPDNYYVQLLHYLLVTDFQFAVLKAQLKYEIDGKSWLNTHHYHLERSEVEGDIEILKKQEIEFWECIKQDKQPPLILPQI